MVTRKQVREEGYVSPSAIRHYVNPNPVVVKKKRRFPIWGYVLGALVIYRILKKKK